jgi:hypothetical protein
MLRDGCATGTRWPFDDGKSRGRPTNDSSYELRTSPSSRWHSTVSLLVVFENKKLTHVIVENGGLYLVLVCSLPNRKYFATMSAMGGLLAVDTSLFQLLVVGSMELIFLAVYCILMSRELGVSGVSARTLRQRHHPQQA